MMENEQKTRQRLSSPERSVVYGMVLFLALLAYETWGQAAFFGKDVPHVITPIISEGLARCSSDIARLCLTVFFLYMAAGCATGIWAHVMARAVMGERRGFRAVFTAELLLVPLYLAATMAIYHPQFYAIKPFFKFVPVYWITAYAAPWMFHAALLVFILAHAGLLVRRYGNWMKQRSRAMLAGAAALLAASLVIAIIERPPGLGSGPVVHDPKHPHVFFFCIDCLRLDRFQRSHYFRNITPNLDAVFADSVVFKKVFSPLAKTYPSWVSFLTSTGIIKNGERWALPLAARRDPRLPTIAQVLDSSGWRSTFYTDDSRYSYMEPWTGFKEIVQPEPGFMNYFAEYSYYYLLVGKLANTRIGNFLFPMTRYNHALSFTYSSRIFYEDYMAHIGREVRKGPLASFSHNVCIHYPGAAPWPYYALFTDPLYRGDNKYLYKVYYLSDVNRDQMLLSKDSNQHYQELYDGMVKMMDDEFGLFVRTLKDLGIYDESLIVVFSDHGEHFSERHPVYEHLPPMHGILLDDDFENRSVLAIKFPKAMQDRIKVWSVPELARLEDIAPTVMDALNLPRPASFDGVSFWPRIQGLAPPPNLMEYMEADLAAGFLLEPGGMTIDAVYTELYDMDPDGRTIGVKEAFKPAILYTKIRALRTNQWKLVRVPKPGGPEWRLFDPNADPHAEHNLAETRPDVLEQMKQKIAPFLAPDRAILDRSPKEMRVREIEGH